jgi:3-methyladenine DNA glycosylase AlkD
MRCAEVMRELESLGNPDDVRGMERFGIRSRKAYGVRAPEIRRLAKTIGVDRALAQELWDSGVYEARILSALIDDPLQLTDEIMEDRVRGFDNWAVCDALCMNLFDRTDVAYSKPVGWSGRPEEFVKRAGFAMIAALAVHDKKADDGRFIDFLLLIIRESTDDRNMVKKAVNWALRQIGKRSLPLNAEAVSAAKKIAEIDSSSARWIASDALRELTGEKVLERLRQRAGRAV